MRENTHWGWNYRRSVNGCINHISRPVLNIIMKKSMSSQLEITLHFLASHYVLHRQLCRHQYHRTTCYDITTRTSTEWGTVSGCENHTFVIYGLIISCKKQDNVCIAEIANCIGQCYKDTRRPNSGFKSIILFCELHNAPWNLDKGWSNGPIYHGDLCSSTPNTSMFVYHKH